MKTRIFHTVNAGLYFESKNTRLLVDGLHSDAEEGFSALPPLLAEQLAAGTGLFFDLDGLVFTHLHGDHFDGDLVRAALALPHAPALLGPVPEGEGFSLPLRGLRREILGDFTLTFIPSTHDGERYVHIPHHSLLLEAGAERFFLAGDACLDPALLEQVLALSGEGPLTAAFVNPLQLLSDTGRDFLAGLGAERIHVIHIPFPEDDVFQFASSTRWAVKSASARLQGLDIPEHMQWLR